MNSQDTPIHIKLWHRDFWFMLLCNLLMSSSVYSMIPAMPSWMETMGYSNVNKGIAMLLFIVGIVVAGPHIDYMLEKHPRKRVCTTAILCLAALFGAMTLICSDEMICMQKSVLLLLLFLFRFLSGAAFGIAQIALLSTLVIDRSNSSQRTEANYVSSWFGRLALALGPFATLIILPLTSIKMVFIVSAVICIACWFIMNSVKIPFKTPKEEYHYFSCDRFFLKQGWWLFLNFILVTISIGMILTTYVDMKFYGMLCVGFMFSIISQRLIFADADLKSEVITGLILIGAAILILITYEQRLSTYLPPTLIGLGLGLISSRFLLFFLKLSKHCQRGTSQSTFIIAWEAGIAIGLFLGFILLDSGTNIVLYVSLSSIVIALVMYNTFTHNWFMTHKNR